MSVRVLAVTRLPGGIPVAITDRDGKAYVYLSEEYDLETIAEALTMAWATFAAA
jgi:hypothetical protein